MLPVINTLATHTPVQTSLVATPLPETNTLRVPFDNVPPPVSSAQLYNNTRGNSGGFVAAEVINASPAPITAAEAATLGYYSGGSIANVGAPATFLAQLMSQDTSAQGRVVLAEYEKIIAISQIKYKPSNASLPPPAPSGLVGRIAQQEQAVQRAQQFIPQPQVDTSPDIQIQLPRQVTAPAPVRRADPSAQAVAADTSETVDTTSLLAQQPPALPVAIRAYTSAATRIFTPPVSPDTGEGEGSSEEVAEAD